MDIDEARSAVACLKRLVQLDPRNVAGWQNLAVALFAYARFDEGISACQQVLELDPTNTPTLYNLALAYERTGDYEQALHWVNKGLAIDAGDAWLQKLGFRIKFFEFRNRVMQAVRTFLHLRLPSR